MVNYTLSANGKIFEVRLSDRLIAKAIQGKVDNYNTCELIMNKADKISQLDVSDEFILATDNDREVIVGSIDTKTEHIIMITILAIIENRNLFVTEN